MQPVVETRKTHTRSSDDSKSLDIELAHDRSGQPFVNHDDSSHEQTMLNEVNMDFRIPELQQSVLKHTQSTSDRELIQKMRTTQTDMLLNKTYDKTKPYNPFSPELKIQDVATWNCLNCLRRTPKRSAKHACHTGVKVLSVAHAGISLKKQ